MPKKSQPRKKHGPLYHHSVIIRIPDNISEEEFSGDPYRLGIIEYFNGNKIVKDYVFQLERGLLHGKLHYQMYVQLCDTLKKRSRFLELLFLDRFASVGVKPSSSVGREALRSYCMKKDPTYVSGPWGKRTIYLGEDLAIMSEPLPWHQQVLDVLATEPDDRTIYYLHEPAGRCGKSKLVKFLCWNKMALKIPLGTASQLKHSTCNRGSSRAYLVDIPRSTGKEESLCDLYSAIEEIKNGFVTSAMYGKYSELYMKPPHIFVFSNDPPNLKYLSMDKWNLSITPAPAAAVPMTICSEALEHLFKF